MSLPYSALGLRSSPPTIARLMTAAIEKPGLLSLAAGFTDNASLPVEGIRGAFEELVSTDSGREYLQYGMNQGRPDLRQILAERLAAAEKGAGTPAHLAEHMLVTNGSQQALYLAMQTLCNPGDIVLVDRPSYFVFLEMLTGLGISALSIPVDEQGAVDGKALEALLASLAARGESGLLKAVYFVSYFSNPSSRSLSEAEKEMIARALSQAGLRVPVIEDAAYRDLYFSAPHKARSVLSLGAWSGFPKLYLSTLTKSFSTGLKVGFGVCTDQGWLERMLSIKGHHDFGTGNFAQALCARVLANGVFDKHLGKLRTLYREKMLALHEGLLAEGLASSGWRWTEPGGGLYLWLKAPHGLDTSMDERFCRACLETGVLYVPGDLCFGDNAPRDQVRLSFGVLAKKDLREAAKRFAAAAKR